MKRILALILAAVMCLYLTACGDEPTLSAKDERKLAKYEKYETLIEYLEDKDYNSALAEIDRLSQTADDSDEDENASDSDSSQTAEPIQLTLENWKDYFELRVFAEYNYNQFGDVERLVLPQYLVLKEGYEPYGNVNDIVIEMRRTAQRTLITVNVDGPSYTLGEVVEERELTPSPDIRSMGHFKEYGYYIDAFSNNYINVADNADPENGSSKEVWLIPSIDCIEATRIKGSIIKR